MLKRDPGYSVHKYPLDLKDEVEVRMPAFAEVLCVQVQNNVPCLWAKVDTRESSIRTRRFFLVGTGNAMPVFAGEYVGTFQLSGGALVFHVFEAE